MNLGEFGPDGLLAASLGCPDCGAGPHDGMPCLPEYKPCVPHHTWAARATDAPQTEDHERCECGALTRGEVRRRAADIFRLAGHPDITNIVDRASDQVSERWRARIVQRIAEKIEKDLRAGLPSLPSTEQQAMAMFKTIARQLQQAGIALERAAEQLKAAGKGIHASEAHVAGQAAQHAASDIIGDGQ